MLESTITNFRHIFFNCYTWYKRVSKGIGTDSSYIVRDFGGILTADYNSMSILVNDGIAIVVAVIFGIIRIYNDFI